MDSKMRQCLPSELIDFLRAAGETADSQGQKLYLVGGAVRDLLLERPNLDFDLVLEGDAPHLARKLASAGEGRVTIHRQFGTAKFRRGELTIDLVMARSESYAKPGALPKVKPGNISDDLARRDFSINAIAIHLNPSSFGQLVDPHNGGKDLERGLIRILHPRSFIDDATRMMRAIRYEGRLGFKLEQDTQRLLRHNLAMLDTISGDRLRHELELILKEDAPERLLKRAQALGVLGQLNPSLKGDDWLAARFQGLRQSQRSELPAPALYLLLMTYRLSKKECLALTERLNISGELERNMLQMARLKGELRSLDNAELPPSVVYRALQHYLPGAIAACLLASDDSAARSHLERYLDELRYVKPLLGGDDLQRMGVKPGPRLGKMLARLRDAKLDGQASTKRDEEVLVRQWLKGD